MIPIVEKAREEKKGFPTCVEDDEGAMVTCNLIYTFSMEFIMFAYMVRLIRVLLVKKIPLLKKVKSKRGGIKTRGKLYDALLWLFQNQNRLVVVSLFWALLIVIVDILMKVYLGQKHRWTNPISLYPQFDCFMCDYEL